MRLTRRELLALAGAAGMSLLVPGCSAHSLPLKADVFPQLGTEKYAFLGLAASLTEEYDYEADVEGEVPEWLRGVLFRNSSSLLERGGRRKRTMFEGDGMVRAYRFHGRGVGFRSRFVRTEKFMDESAAGKFLYPTFSTQAPGGLIENFWAGGKIKSQAQISVVPWMGKLYAFDESSLPYELDPETLETYGVSDLGVNGAVYSAHSKIDPRTGEWILFGLHYGRHADLHVAILDRGGRPETHRVITLPRYVHVHDFFATENHLIFNLHPVEIRLPGFLLGIRSLAESFEWRPEEGNLIMVLNRRDGSPPAYLEAGPSFMWHSINAYEEDGLIKADFVGYKSPDHFLGNNSPVYAVMRGEKGEYKDKGEIRRYVIDLGRGRLSEETIFAGAGYEWPMIDLSARCYAYRTAYLAKTRGDDFFWSGVSAMDIATGDEEVYYFGEGQYCMEPIFAPDPVLNGPDKGIGKGWLLTEVYDGNTKKGFLAVLRADRVSDGPVAKVHLRHHLPFSMHGFWQGA